MDNLEGKKGNLPLSVESAGPLTLADLADVQLRALGLPAGPEMGAPGGLGNSGEDFSVRTLLYMVFRHKWKIVLFFLVMVVGAVHFVSIQPDKFISEARILIRSERRGVAVDPMSDGSSHYKESSYGGTRYAEFGILQSWRIAEQVVDRLGVGFVLGAPEVPEVTGGGEDDRAVPTLEAPAPNEQMLAARQNASAIKKTIRGWIDDATDFLNITPVQIDARNIAIMKVMGGLQTASYRDSEVIIATYTDYDPHRSQTVLNAILDVYLAEHIEIFKSQISPNYFKSKADEWKVKFDEKEDELRKLRHELNVRSYAEENTALIQRLQNLEAQLSDLDIKERSNQARMTRMAELLKAPAAETAAAIPFVASENSMIGRLQSKLIDLQLEEARMAAIYTDEAAQIKAVRRQIAETEKMIGDEIKKSTTAGATSPSGMTAQLNPTMVELRTRYQALELDQQALGATRSILAGQLDNVRGRLDKLSDNDQRFQNLMMQKRILEQEYLQYLNSFQIAEITQTLDQDRISNVRVLQTATYPGLSTKSPRKMLALLAFGCFVGLFGGIALAIAREMFDQSIKTSDDVEKKLGLPHLISIPASRRIQPRLRKLET